MSNLEANVPNTLLLLDKNFGTHTKSREKDVYHCFSINHKHNDKKPALKYNSKKKFFHCFVCGISGNSSLDIILHFLWHSYLKYKGLKKEINNKTIDKDNFLKLLKKYNITYKTYKWLKEYEKQHNINFDIMFEELYNKYKTDGQIKIKDLLNNELITNIAQEIHKDFFGEEFDVTMKFNNKELIDYSELLKIKENILNKNIKNILSKNGLKENEINEILQKYTNDKKDQIDKNILTLIEENINEKKLEKNIKTFLENIAKNEMKLKKEVLQHLYNFVQNEIKPEIDQKQLKILAKKYGFEEILSKYYYKEQQYKEIIKYINKNKLNIKEEIDKIFLRGPSKELIEYFKKRGIEENILKERGIIDFKYDSLNSIKNYISFNISKNILDNISDKSEQYINEIFLPTNQEIENILYFNKEIFSKNAKEIILKDIKKLKNGNKNIDNITKRLLGLFFLEKLGVLKKGYFTFTKQRIIFPFFDENGKIEGSNFRILSQEKTADGEIIINEKGEKELLDKSRRFTNLGIVEIFNKDLLAKYDTIFITEGGSDALTLIQLGYPAISIPGASRSISAQDMKLFFGKNVVILGDNDEPGRQFIDRLSKQLASIVNITDKNGTIPHFFIPEKYNVKDINEFIQKYGPTKTKQFIEEMLQKNNLKLEPKKIVQKTPIKFKEIKNVNINNNIALGINTTLADKNNIGKKEDVQKFIKEKGIQTFSIYEDGIYELNDYIKYTQENNLNILLTYKVKLADKFDITIICNNTQKYIELLKKFKYKKITLSELKDLSNIKDYKIILPYNLNKTFFNIELNEKNTFVGIPVNYMYNYKFLTKNYSYNPIFINENKYIFENQAKDFYVLDKVLKNIKITNYKDFEYYKNKHVLSLKDIEKINKNLPEEYKNVVNNIISNTLNFTNDMILNSDIEPIHGKAVLPSDLLLPKEKQRKYARFAKNNYEVSSKGDKRFSAFYARIKDKNFLNDFFKKFNVDIEEKDYPKNGFTIEQLYQLYIKGYWKEGYGLNDLLKIKGKKPLNNIDIEEQYEEYKKLWKQYLDENPELFKELIKNTEGKTITDMFASGYVSQAKALAELVNNELIKIEFKKLIFYMFDEKSAKEKIPENQFPLIVKNLKSRNIINKIPKDKIKEYYKRITEEIETFTSFNDPLYFNYFAILADAIAYLKSKGHIIGFGRGSAAGSLISYILGLTEIDPLKYSLLFYRFLNPARKDYPDIDIDLDEDAKKEIEQYLKNKYGEDNIVLLSVLNKIGVKQSVQDVLRILGYKPEKISKITQYYEENDTEKIKKFEEELDKFLKENKLEKYKDIIFDLVGENKNKTIHPSAVVIGDEKLTMYPILKTDKGLYVIDTDQKGLSSIGIKFDFLSSKILQILKYFFKEKNRFFPEDKLQYDPDTIYFDDKEVYKHFKIENFKGIPQYDNQDINERKRKERLYNIMNITNLEANADFISIIRPGAWRFKEEYLLNKHLKYIKNEPLLDLFKKSKNKEIQQIQQNIEKIYSKLFILDKYIKDEKFIKDLDIKSNSKLKNFVEQVEELKKEINKLIDIKYDIVPKILEKVVKQNGKIKSKYILEDKSIIVKTENGKILKINPDESVQELKDFKINKDNTITYTTKDGKFITNNLDIELERKKEELKLKIKNKFENIDNIFIFKEFINLKQKQEKQRFLFDNDIKNKLNFLFDEIVTETDIKNLNNPYIAKITKKIKEEIKNETEAGKWLKKIFHRFNFNKIEQNKKVYRDFLKQLKEIQEIVFNNELYNNELYKKYTFEIYNTYGTLLYQEQFMEILRNIGINEGDVNVIRSALSKKKKEIIKNYEDVVIQKLKEAGFEENIALYLWKKIEQASKYSFNKSHAIAYAMTSFLFMKIKKEYNLLFRMSYNNVKGKIFEIPKEAYISHPLINHSEIYHSKMVKWNGEFKIIPPLKEIDYLNRNKDIAHAIKEIEPVKTFDEFIDKLSKKIDFTDKLIIELIKNKFFTKNMVKDSQLFKDYLTRIKDKNIIQYYINNKIFGASNPEMK